MEVFAANVRVWKALCGKAFGPYIFIPGKQNNHFVYLGHRADSFVDLTFPLPLA